MKMTIVTDSAGKIIGAVQGHELTQKVGDLQATVSFGPGHKLHQVDVGDDMAMVDDAAEYQRKLAAHLPKHP